ncbi:MAG: glycoside hydrolase family 36 protein, partial [Gemmiger sp.]|nr:glycoside hydrolase family 36 protein [Gemmiger sp.]
WCKTLAPGACFTAPKAVLTAVCGGVDTAAQVLAENTRRAIEPLLPASEKTLPVLFNEFCSTWGKPTEETVLRHVRALKGKNLGYYVIDAGWYDDDAFEAAAKLGRWELSRKAFPHGLKYVVDAIHDTEMKAGIWFEFEVAGRDEPDCFNKTELLLTCDGRPITAGDRRFWDMRKPEVQEYLAHRVIDFLRDNDIDYMKVDYNENIGLGCDGAESLGEGLYEQILASQQFFARIRRELPDLVLELCASGGHRLCHSCLELSCMASFSDAHECDEIPIIAANMHRMILPRQSQIWAVVKAGQPLQKLYYQICSGLLGRLCFSGEPDALSAAQWTVMDEGTAFYGKAASIIDHGVSQRFGSRIVSYRAPRGWQAVVRRGETRTLVVVHTFGAAPEAVTLPVGGKIAAQLMRDGLTVTHPDGQLTVHGLTDFDAAAFILENEG